MIRYFIVCATLGALALSCTENQSKDFIQASDTIAFSPLFVIRDSFPKQNLTSFDLGFSRLDTFYSSFPPIENNQLDSIVDLGKHYLYSWQGDSENPSLTEFTCLTVTEYRGLILTYIIVDRFGKVVSANKVASRNGEDGVLFETTSKINSKNIISTVDIISTGYERRGTPPYKNLKKPFGDSIFSQIVFDSNGRSSKIMISQKKEIN